MDQDPKTGRFVKGNRASPGRRPRKVEDDLQRILFEKTRSEWENIVKAMIEAAKEKNVYAARFIAEYAIGKPLLRLAFELDPVEQQVIAELHDAAKSAGVPFTDLIRNLLDAIYEGGSDDREDEDNV